MGAASRKKNRENGRFAKKGFFHRQAYRFTNLNYFLFFAVACFLFFIVTRWCWQISTWKSFFC